MKYVLGFLATALLFPVLAHASLVGQYKMNNDVLIQQVKQRWGAKLPKEQLQKMLDGMKTLQATMWLHDKGKFRGIATVPNRKKKSVATGTWKKVAKGIVIHTVNQETKKKSVMHCTVKKQTLFCKGANSPLVMQFDKK